MKVYYASHSHFNINVLLYVYYLNHRSRNSSQSALKVQIIWFGPALVCVNAWRIMKTKKDNWTTTGGLNEFRYRLGFKDDS